MPQPLDYTPIIRKLLEKSERGRLDWEDREGGFGCNIEGGYAFNCRQVDDDSYVLTMRDAHGRLIFDLVAHGEIVFANEANRDLYKMLRDVYELARRKALGVDEKLVEVSKVLDAI